MQRSRSVAIAFLALAASLVYVAGPSSTGAGTTVWETKGFREFNSGTPREIYTSARHDAGSSIILDRLSWDGATPHGSKLAFAVRGADSLSRLDGAGWTRIGEYFGKETNASAPVGPAHRWWQYRAILEANGPTSPVLTGVRLMFRSNRLEARHVLQNFSGGRG